MGRSRCTQQRRVLSWFLGSPAGRDHRQPAGQDRRGPRNGWLGEIEGLQVSLDAAKAKMASVGKAYRVRSTAADLGIPTIRDSK
jgi:hypothetical protein